MTPKHDEVRKDMESKVNIRQSGGGYLIEITDTPIEQLYAITRDELEKIVSFGKSPDRELARFQGVVIGRASEGSTVAVEFLFDGHTETADFPIDMFNGNLALYGQPVDIVVRVRADGKFRYLHFEARPAGTNPALPELERLLSGIG